MSYLTDELLGFVMPLWVKPLIIVIALAVLTGFIFHKGELRERTKWVNKESAELVSSQKRILNLTEQNRALESLRVIEAANITNHYQGIIQDEKDHANAVIANVRAGSQRLSIATKQTVPACTSGISLTPASTGTVGTETRSELSAAAAEFLIRFASDADEAVINGNEVKDLLLQCRAHVDSLRAQSLNQVPSSLTTTLKLNSKTKENQ